MKFKLQKICYNYFKFFRNVVIIVLHKKEIKIKYLNKHSYNFVHRMKECSLIKCIEYSECRANNF